MIDIDAIEPRWAGQIEMVARYPGRHPVEQQIIDLRDLLAEVKRLHAASDARLAGFGRFGEGAAERGRLIRERDEARAEVERLRDALEHAPWKASYMSMRAQRNAAKAEVERLQVAMRAIEERT